MNTLRHTTAIIACLALALVCACLGGFLLAESLPQAFAEQGSSQQDAEGEGDSGDSADDSDEPEETPIEKAKRLIALLPGDPGDVTEADWAALSEAQEAYDSLTSAERADLDDIYLGKEKSYGRWLQTAQWGYLALQPVNNTLSLIDGNYSAYVSSESGMGKSTSSRSKTWSVVSLEVSGEQAWGIIRCDSTSSFRLMRIGGATYTATVEGGVPEFEVPIAVNDTSTFLVTANNESDYVAVQIAVTLPMKQASADEVSTAKSAAQKTLSGDLGVYTDESAAALKEAANALMQVASKSGVATIELNIAAANLNSAIAKAEKRPVKKDPKKTSPTPSGKNGKSGKTKSSSSAKKSSSKPAASKASQTAPKASAATPARTTGASNLRAPSVSSASKSASSSSTSSKSASSSAASSKASAADDGADKADDDPRQATVTELSASSEPDDETITRVVIILGILGFVLAGMCARTFLFVHSKEVA